jgi:phosphoglycolate phosphatase-like HAD superfamily hydrolase
VAVFDVDGVVADVRHRLHYLEGRYKDWDGFFDEAELDPPLAFGVELVLAALDAGHEVVWLTGRPEWLRAVTRQWLKALDLPTNELLMREYGDFRPARIMKLQALYELEPRDIVSFVDDDPDVVDTALAAHFPAILATWVPHSKTLRRAQELDGRT